MLFGVNSWIVRDRELSIHEKIHDSLRCRLKRVTQTIRSNHEMSISQEIDLVLEVRKRGEM